MLLERNKDIHSSLEEKKPQRIKGHSFISESVVKGKVSGTEGTTDGWHQEYFKYLPSSVNLELKRPGLRALQEMECPVVWKW